MAKFAPMPRPPKPEPPKIAKRRAQRRVTNGAALFIHGQASLGGKPQSSPTYCALSSPIWAVADAPLKVKLKSRSRAVRLPCRSVAKKAPRKSFSPVPRVLLSKRSCRLLAG